MDITKKAAEILVECGYAISLPDQSRRREDYYGEVLRSEVMGKGERCFSVCVSPFSDTLEGRRQIEAIEDWLHVNEPELIRRAKHCSEPVPYNGRQKRINRTEWCLEELSK